VRCEEGIYVDGHERKDVVNYRQNEFLPQLAALQPSIVEWDAELKRLPKELPKGER